MSSSYKTEQSPLPATPIAVLSGLTLISGAGGMALSFPFLASNNYLDVIAGAAGFIGGAVLIAAGLISLAVQRKSPMARESAIHAIGCLAGFLPPIVAALTCPVVYFGAFFIGILFGVLLLPFVLFACILWAWEVSISVAVHLSALCGWSHVRILRVVVFLFQIVGIVASWPLFVYLLNLLEAMGYKVGWS